MSILVRKVSTLTDKQMRILDLVSYGLPTASIAEEMNRPAAAIRSDLFEIRKALGVSSTLKAAEIYINWIEETPH